MVNRKETLPCGHKFTFYEPQGKNYLLKCTTCNWSMLIMDRPIRKTDPTHKEFVEKKDEFNG